MIREALEKVAYSEIMVHTGLSDAYSKIGNHQKAAEEEKIIHTLLDTYDDKNKKSYNSQSSGCFSTIFVMCIVLFTLMFVW